MTITTVHRVSTSQPVVSITFDDGPHPDYTPKALAIMDKYKMKGTWFIVGELAAKAPRLLASIKEHGHDVATHSYKHIFLTNLDYNGVVGQLSQTKQVIQKQTGKFWPLIRPPYGAFNAAVLRAAEAQGHKWNVLWSVDPRDWESPTNNIISDVIAVLAPGAIILLHEATPRTTEALPSIFQEMKKRGLRSVPLSQLLAGQPALPSVSVCRTLVTTSPNMYGEDIEAVQLALISRGFDPGMVDSLYGSATAQAVSKFQASKGMTPTGTVDSATYKALGVRCAKTPAGVPPSRPR